MKNSAFEKLAKAHLIFNTIQEPCLEINSSSIIVFVNKRAEENQKKIFDRFFRFTTSNRDSFPHMGSGLYITAQIIHQPKGTINIKSNPEKGSVFSFTIPYINH